MSPPETAAAAPPPPPAPAAAAAARKAKNIVITGGARGIGRVLARHLLQAGHRVFLLDVEEAELKHTVDTHLPTALGEDLAAILSTRLAHAVCDLCDVPGVRAAIESAAKFFDQRIDVLVNNAGLARAFWKGGITMEDPSTVDQWAEYMATNLTGPFVVSQACIPFMKAARAGFAEQDTMEAVLNSEVHGDRDELAGGCIINISSFRAKQSMPHCEGYASSKAGLLGLTHAMATSGANWGIRCNAILPGFIDVRHENREADEAGAKWASDIPEARHRQHLVGRIGIGKDVAETVEWLMIADFVTGQEIVVDGGVSKIRNTAA